MLDGAVLEAELSVFEDRGAGDVLWTGRLAGASGERVLFTLQGGAVIGWLDQPGGSSYIVLAGPEGTGTMAVETEPAGDWCLVEVAGDDLRRPLARASGSVGPALAASGHGRLDILVVYTHDLAETAKLFGGVEALIQARFDFLNMAFQSGDVPVTVRPIPMLWEGSPYSGGRRQPVASSLPSDQHRLGFVSSWLRLLEKDPEVDRLRVEHGADLVHLFVRRMFGALSGRARRMRNTETRTSFANSGFGLSTPWRARTLAHEVGHNLGGGHDPPNAGDPSTYIRPYAFGHTDLTAKPRPVATIMSYGTVPEGSPAPDWEPFYSSVRHRPNGWSIGIHGERENERVFQETIHWAVEFSSHASHRTPGPASVRGRWRGLDRVRLSWANVPSGGESITVWQRLGSGFWETRPRRRNPLRPQAAHAQPGVRQFRDDAGNVVGAEISGLAPGGRYSFAVRAGGLRSEVVTIEPLRDPGAPEAPSDLGQRATGPDSLMLTWADNSDDETGFEVWFREFSGDDPLWRRYGSMLPAGTVAAEIGGLSAEEDVRVARSPDGEGALKRGRYAFVVVAHNDSGSSNSRVFDVEFVLGPHSQPTPAGELTDCIPRAAMSLGRFEVRACFETPDGTRGRTWAYGLDSVQSGLLYFFGRANPEILAKVLDGCAINGYYWVFVAPVTDLAVNLAIYDRFGDRWWRSYRNRQGITAQPVVDTSAFPCALRRSTLSREGSNDGDRLLSREVIPALGGSAPGPDCVPKAPALTLDGGYRVSMCYETDAGLVGDAVDWGLDARRAGLLYFFDRDNVEVLIKVLDGCAVNGHRWVFVAPVTTLAFNLQVEAPNGARWTHTNRQGETALARSDTSAFPCS